MLGATPRDHAQRVGRSPNCYIRHVAPKDGDPTTSGLVDDLKNKILLPEIVPARFLRVGEELCVSRDVPGMAGADPLAAVEEAAVRALRARVAAGEVVERSTEEMEDVYTQYERSQIEKDLAQACVAGFPLVQGFAKIQTRPADDDLHLEVLQFKEQTPPLVARCAARAAGHMLAAYCPKMDSIEHLSSAVGKCRAVEEWKRDNPAYVDGALLNAEPKNPNAEAAYHDLAMQFGLLGPARLGLDERDPLLPQYLATRTAVELHPVQQTKISEKPWRVPNLGMVFTGDWEDERELARLWEVEYGDDVAVRVARSTYRKLGQAQKYHPHADGREPVRPPHVTVVDLGADRSRVFAWLRLCGEKPTDSAIVAVAEKYGNKKATERLLTICRLQFVNFNLTTKFVQTGGSRANRDGVPP